MEEMNHIKLKTDERFQRLVYPMDRRNFIQLETDILSGLSDEPVAVWNGYLIDGFSRYQIFSAHQMPFRMERLEFSCWESAAAWICTQQLKRKDIPEEMRRFLIGTQYLLEKEGARLCCGSDKLPVKQYESVCHQIAVRLGTENHVARATVQKYAAYAQALELVRERSPKAAENILAGHSKISHKKLVILSKLEGRAVQQAVRRFEAMRQPLFSNGVDQRGSQAFEKNPGKPVSGPSVKDMPAFDPDVEITGLILTIPSWCDPGVICAVTTLENICLTYGYHALNRVLRLIVGTWEGDINSFSSNMLNAVARLVTTFGDTLNDEIFKERVGNISVKQLIRAAKDRRPGSAGLAEAMLAEYNGKRRNAAGKLSVSKLRSKELLFFRKGDDTCGLDTEGRINMDEQGN